MIQSDIMKKVLFEPLSNGADELFILSAYATPNMLSWYIKNVYEQTRIPIKINLVVGMIPFDNLSMNVHEGFKQLVSADLSHEIESVKCSYVIDSPAVHANLYIWCKAGQPQAAFFGSANFIQSSFIGNLRQEIMSECSAEEAMDFFNSIVPRTVYCNHAEIEEYVILLPSHPVLDLESNLINTLDNYDSVVLSLVTKTGEPGKRSGLNWGQRKGLERAF